MFVKDLSHFLQKLDGLCLEPDDVLVSFDVVSLFTTVPVQEVVGFIGELFLADITYLFRQVVTTTYFQWNGGFCDQTGGVAMSPTVANFYMEKFKEMTITCALLRPCLLYTSRCV